MLSVRDDKLLVKPIDETGERTTASGLYIPESVDAGQILRGEVVNKGKGSVLQDGSRVAIDIKIGDVVLFPKFKAIKIDDSGETFYVISETMIVAVVE